MKSPRRRNRQWLWTAASLALVVGHGIALPYLLAELSRESLVVEVQAPLYTPGPSLHMRAAIPKSVQSRTELWIDGRSEGRADKHGSALDPKSIDRELAPGMHWVEWWASYMGGVERRVGRAQIVGPFQNPAAPPCSVRILFSQSLLDDGADRPGSVSALIRELASRELAGFDRWPVGRFQRIDKVRLRWVGRDLKRKGHLRIELAIRMAKATVKVAVRVVPRIVDGRLDLQAHTDANVSMDSRIAGWVVKLIRGDSLLTRLLRSQISPLVRQVIAVPPPVALGGGRSIRLQFCGGRQLEIEDDRYGAVWLSVAIEGTSDSRPGPVLLPAQLGPSPLGPLNSPIAIELDGNALNAVLYQMWSSGFLQDAIDDSNILDQFHDDPVVSRLLSLKIRDPKLLAPPTVTAGQVGQSAYQLGLLTEFQVDDSGRSTEARLFGRAELTMVDGLKTEIAVGQLGVACHGRGEILEPCYPDIVDQLRSRAPDLHGVLSSWFSNLLERLLIGRELGAPETVGRIRVTGSNVRLPPPGLHGPMRVEIFGAVAE